MRLHTVRPMSNPAPLASTFVAALRPRHAKPSHPLAILHGILASSQTYSSLIRREDFAPTSPRLSIDLPGHGRSPWISDGCISYPSMASAVVRTLSASCSQPTDIVGHSMGGKVGMAMALLYPSAVRRLVVIDIAPIDYSSPPRRGTTENAAAINVPETALSAMENLNREGLEAGAFPKRSDVDSGLLRHGVVDASVRQFVSTNLVATKIGCWRWRCDVNGLLKALPVVAGFDLGKMSNSTFEGEVLFVAGGRSNYVQDQDLEVILSKFPNARIKTLDACGHWLQAEDPTGFCEIATPFLVRP